MGSSKLGPKEKLLRPAPAPGDSMTYTRSGQVRYLKLGAVSSTQVILKKTKGATNKDHTEEKTKL